MSMFEQILGSMIGFLLAQLIIYVIKKLLVQLIIYVIEKIEKREEE